MEKRDAVRRMREAKENYEKYSEIYYRTLDGSYRVSAQWCKSEFERQARLIGDMK